MSVRAVRLAICAAAVILLCSIVPHPPRIPAPGLVLWAWERPEDLRFIDPASTGVASLAATIELQSDGRAKFHFRQQQLRVPAGVSQIAVVRIETPARYVFPSPGEIVAGITAIAQNPDIQALQIDYDARASERPFYRALLAALRKTTGLPVGITALASWCEGDSWLDGEPVSEAVPMFFRMGAGESKEMPVRSLRCQASVGLSTDEPWPTHRPRGIGRIYVFNPHAWTRRDYAAVVRRIKEWR